MNGIWRKSVLTRLFAFFSLILLPTCTLSVVIYNWGIDEVVEKVNSSSYLQMEEYIKRFEQEVRRMKVIQFEFINDRDLDHLATIPSYMPWLDQYKAFQGLQQRIGLIKNSSKYANDVNLYLPRAGKVISTSNGISPIKSEEEKDLIYGNMDGFADTAIHYRDENMFVDLDMMPPDFSDQETLLFKIEIQLNQSVLQDDLDHLGNQEVNVLLLRDKNTNRVIVKSHSEEPNLVELLSEAERMTGLNGETIQQIEINGVDYSALTIRSEELNMTMVKFIREGQYLTSLKKYNIWLWLFSAVTFLAVAMFLISAYKVVYNPLRILSSAFKRVESRNFNIQITHLQNDEFGFIYRSFNNMVMELKVLIEQVYEQKILTQRSQMKHLQSQINPHFLYNNFQIIHRMAKLEDHDDLADLSIKLAQYYQYVTRNTSDEVPFAKELEFAQKYVDIQSVRFQNRLSVEFADIPAGIGHIMVPRIILQPILENAFEHGLKNKAANARLWITFEVTEFVAVIIEDNGEGLPQGELLELQQQIQGGSFDSETTGLVNIHRRMQLKFGAESGLQVSIGKSGGLQIRLHLAKESESDV